MSRMDWRLWHEGYSDPDSAVSARLPVVRGRIRDFLGSRPDDEFRVLSLCAGKGLDLLGALSEHQGAERVRARLIELDPDLATAARTRAAQDGLDRVEVALGDASITDVFAEPCQRISFWSAGCSGTFRTKTLNALSKRCRSYAPNVVW